MKMLYNGTEYLEYASDPEKAQNVIRNHESIALLEKYRTEPSLAVRGEGSTGMQAEKAVCLCCFFVSYYMFPLSGRP